jgi:DNA-binding MarR family transcriptional regulator
MPHRADRSRVRRLGDPGVARVTFRAPLLPSRRRAQELPASLAHWTGFAVIVAAHDVEVRYELALRDTGISIRDFAVLAEARQRRGIGQRGLAQRVGIGYSSLSNQLSWLASAGLVRRGVSERDLRRRSVLLTPEGDHALAVARDLIDAAEKEWLAPLSEAERPAFRAGLERLLPETYDLWSGYRLPT